MMMTRAILFLLPLVLGAPGATPAPQYTVRTVPLPGGSDQGISMDYVAFDARTGFVWVPAGNTGAVDVIDTGHGDKVTQVPGFPTAEVPSRAGKRVVGPSSAAVGDGIVYIGNRGDSTVCAVDERSLARVACGHLDSMPDGLAYVALTKEVWVTTPRDNSVRVLDASTLAQKARLAFDGQPEGFAVDAVRGRFYTNLEDKDRTLAIDLRTHETVATWNPACGEDGPKGLRVDEKAGFLFVACDAAAKALDVGHGGAVLSSIETGAGVDDMDYAPGTHLLYVAAAKAAQLTVARVDDAGRLSVVSRVATRPGARNGVVGKDGRVYLAHGSFSKLNELVVVEPSAR
jgi:DNA-binding beta-propeller fold protein YncE